MNYSKLKNLLLNLDNNLPIYLAGHLTPDQDSVCSCLALAEFLNLNNKKVKVLIKDEDKDIISWHENTRFLCSSVSDEVYAFVALDLNEKKRLGVFEKDFDNALLTFNIDHHENNKFEARYTLTDSNMSATCEMVYNLIKYNKNNFTKDICEYLYAGILNDTNCFSRRLTKNTLKIAQNIINFGINYKYIINKTFSECSLYELKALAEVVNLLQYDDFYYVVIDKEKAVFKDLTHNQIVKKLAEEVRKVNTIDNLVFLIKNKNTIKAKVMTNLTDEASIIAELFGGGGHKREAGFTTEKTAEEIIKTIKNYFHKSK